MHDSSPFFYPLYSPGTLLLRSHVHHELSPSGYRSSAHESNLRVAALDSASRRGEQRGKQSAPPRPPGRWESLCSQRAVGWQSSHISQGSVGKGLHLSISLFILRFCGRLKLTRSAEPSKNTVSSDLDKTNLCHPTEIPHFTQLSLSRTHSRLRLLPVPVAFSLWVAQTSAPCYQTS